MLTDVTQINQNDLLNMFRFAIDSAGNVIVLGPSGGGKTEMAMQACEEKKCNLVYINLSVLERTDMQGLPVLSSDRKLVSYATPEFLPFADTRDRDYLNTLRDLKEYASFKYQGSNLKDIDNLEALIENEMSETVFKQRIQNLKNNIDSVKHFEAGNSNKLKKLLSSDIMAEAISKMDGRPIVFLFDEVDKALHETTNILLEFLQFRSINGRKLNIQSCLLTGNLPDEYANSNQISHAITKRCMTFKLELDFNQWKEWAFNNGVHDEIIGFLMSKREYLYKKPIDNDPTAYALPSPRTWTSASKALWHLAKTSLEKDDEFKTKIIAGNVGETAAVEFMNWLKYYRRLDPVISDLVMKGKHPKTDQLDNQEMFLCALASCSRIYSSLKPNNQDIINKYTKNVYGWLKTLPEDVLLSTTRMSFGGEAGFENIRKYGLLDIPEFSETLLALESKLGMHLNQR